MARSLGGAFLLLASTPFAATPLSFNSPACGQVANGVVSLSVSAGSAHVARVRYSMGSYSIASLPGPDFGATWNTAEAMDGTSAIQAQGFDALGNLIASAECQVQISNRQASLSVNSPDFSQTVSGTVPVSVTGSDALAFPAVWTLNIDGEEQSTIWTDNTWKSPLTVSFSVDTTRFANGPHELHISMNSRSGPSNPEWVNWRGMVNRVIQIENGHAWMDSSALFQNVYLQPGQQIALGCKRLYTDGQTGACGAVSYQSANPAVAFVNSSGLVLAVQNGFAQVSLSDGARGSTANIWVTSDPRIPHFQGNGVMRQGYDPAKSFFPIAPFFLDPPSLTQNAGLQAEAVRAGVNTLGFGVYLNPRNNSTTYTSWQSSFDQTVLPKMQWAQANGFHLLLTGDDIFRNIGTDAWFTLNWPSGKQAVQYAVNQMAATGVGIGIEAIDEVSSIWGARPVPQGQIGQSPYLFNRVSCASGLCTVSWPQNPVPNGWKFAFQAGNGVALSTAPGTLLTAQNATNNGFSFQTAPSVTGTFTPATTPSLSFLWFAGNYCTGGTVCNPAVPNNGLELMRNWMRGSASPVPVTFPPLATSPPAVHGNWMGAGSLSDYASDYFSSVKTRTTYPWSEGIQEMTYSMCGSFYGRQSYLMLDRPQLMLVSLAGPSYTKRSQGGAVYQAGIDSLDEPGVSPQHVSALMMEAAALGGAGLRLYLFESPADLATRAAASPGSYFQTGTNPTNLQPASWTAMSYASNLITKVLQPFLLGTARNSPAYGRNIVTAARAGADGSMLLIVNGNDWSRTVPVDFSSFAHHFGVARYRLQASGIQTSLLPASASGDSVTLGPGETVAYVFPNAAAAMPLRLVAIAPSSPGGQLQGVRYGYIYPGSSSGATPTACSTTCAPALDVRLGPVFYEFVGTGESTTENEMTLSQ